MGRHGSAVRTRALIGAALWVLSPSLCRAQSEARVQIEVDEECSALLTPQALDDALGLELLGASERVRSYIAETRPRVSLRCADGELVVQLVADDGAHIEESVTTLHLGLARFVAISIAEGVEARAVAPRAAHPEPAAPPPTQPVTPAAEPAPRPSSAVWLRAAGGAMFGGTPGWWTGQGLVGASFEMDLLVLGLDVSVGYGALAVELGAVEATRGGVGAAIGVGGSWSVVHADATLGIVGGWISWAGTSRLPSVLADGGTAGWLGPDLRVRVALALDSNVRIELEGEGGLLVVSSRATSFGSQVAALDPAWLAIRLGIGIRIGP